MTYEELLEDAFAHVVACKVRDAVATGATLEQIKAAALNHAALMRRQAVALVGTLLEDPAIAARVQMPA